MGKSRRPNVRGRDSKPRDVSDTEEYADAVDPNASDFIYDNVDEYFETQEREAAEKLSRLMKKPRAMAEEEVLGVASSSDEDEVPKKRKKAKRKTFEEAEPIPLDSDLEDNELDNDEEITTEWGKKRSAYYSADYVDEEWDDANESDAEVAELEEQEALAIQQRMAQQLEDADFGLEFITHLKEAEKVKESKPAGEEKIDVNLSQLSRREKLKLLSEESPELLELADDFKLQMTELKNSVQPLLKLVTDGVLPPSPGANYIKTRYHLIINYCMQIGYYFVLKSKRISVQNHPVIKRLVQFRSLLHQLETVGSRLQPEIEDLLTKIREQKEIKKEDFVQTVVPPQKKLRILDRATAKLSDTKKDEKKSSKNTGEEPFKKSRVQLTRDEESALEFYRAVRQQKDKDVESSSEEDNEPSTQVDSNPVEEAEEVGKRGINYQIAKNKGLTPHRPKEQRNPRVKHRMKFRKAKIRRKGAIREPRKELQRYGGENSGIKATVVRSIKLK